MSFLLTMPSAAEEPGLLLFQKMPYIREAFAAIGNAVTEISHGRSILRCDEQGARLLPDHWRTFGLERRDGT